VSHKFGGRQINDVNDFVLAGATGSELWEILEGAEAWTEANPQNPPDEGPDNEWANKLENTVLAGEAISKIVLPPSPDNHTGMVH
jgi:hypothetical protein